VVLKIKEYGKIESEALQIYYCSDAYCIKNINVLSAEEEKKNNSHEERLEKMVIPGANATT